MEGRPAKPPPLTARTKNAAKKRSHEGEAIQK
jgi:hypothetical protein